MNLWEIFDTNVSLTWSQTGAFELARLVYEGNTYTIQIHQITLNQIPELTNKKTAEVSFFRDELDDQASFTTTNNIKTNPSKLYGVISNSLIMKFEKYDAFFFSAERAHSWSTAEYETKINIYKFIAARLCKKYGAQLYQKPGNRSSDFVVSKIKINHVEYRNIVRDAIEHLHVTII